MIPLSEGFTPQCTAEVRSTKEKGRNGMFDVGGERKTNKESRNPGRSIVKEELRRKKEARCMRDIIGGVKSDRRLPLKLARCPHSLAASLAALPSMSLIPSAPFADLLLL